MTALEARAKFTPDIYHKPDYSLDEILEHIERVCDTRLFVYGYCLDRLSDAVRDGLLDLGYRIIPYDGALAISWK